MIRGGGALQQQQIQASNFPPSKEDAGISPRLKPQVLGQHWRASRSKGMESQDLTDFRVERPYHTCEILCFAGVWRQHNIAKKN